MITPRVADDDPGHHSPLGDRRRRPGRRRARGRPGVRGHDGRSQHVGPKVVGRGDRRRAGGDVTGAVRGQPGRRHRTGGRHGPRVPRQPLQRRSIVHHAAPRADPALQDRLFAEVARVLRPGAPFVASDSLPSPQIEAGHEGDTYNPVDPEGLPRRLAAAGFTKVEVKTSQFGWASLAKKA